MYRNNSNQFYFARLFRNLAFVSVVTILNLPLTQTTFAQSSLTIEEVTVTARKVEENLQDVPISITAFGAQDIENHGFQDLEDIDTLVPNFKLDQGQGFATDTSIAIRGVAVRDVSTGFDPTFGVIIDDVYIGRALGFNSTLLDLERLEVLRGPQGTLQGRNVVGGSINMTTAKPTHEYYFKTRASYGRFESYQLSGVVSGPLQEGTLAGKVAVTHRDGGGWANQVDLGGDLGDYQSTAIRTQLLFTPSDALEIIVTGDYTIDDINDIGLDLDPDATLTKPNANLLGRSMGGEMRNLTERDIYGFALNANYDLNNGMRFVSVSSYRGFEVEQVLDGDNEPNVTTGTGTIGVGFFPPGSFFLLHTYSEREQEQFSQEIRLHSAQEQRLRWLAGFLYYHEKLETYGVSNAGPYFPNIGLLGGAAISDSVVETDNFAIFSSIDFDITEQLNFSVGLRYDNNKRDATVEEILATDGFALFPLAPPPPLGPPGGLVPAPFTAISTANLNPHFLSDFAAPVTLATTDSSLRDSELTGDITLSYQWNHDVSTYAKYSRGFKGGGFNVLFERGGSGDTVKPEFVNSYEIGLRSYWLDRRLRLNVTGFYLKYKDQQVRRFNTSDVGGFTFVIANEPETESYGSEIEAMILLSERLTLNLSAGFLDTEFKKGSLFAGGAIDTTGNTPFNSPDITFSSLMQYTQPIGNNLELYLMGEASWTDDYFTDSNNFELSRQFDYWMLNIRGGIQSADGRWSVRAYGRNLLDEDIVTTALTSPLIPFASIYALQDPITYGVELSYNYQ